MFKLAIYCKQVAGDGSSFLTVSFDSGSSFLATFTLSPAWAAATPEDSNGQSMATKNSSETSFHQTLKWLQANPSQEKSQIGSWRNGIVVGRCVGVMKSSWAGCWRNEIVVGGCVGVMESSRFGSRTTPKPYQVATRILITTPKKKLTLGLIKVGVVRRLNHTDPNENFWPTLIFKFLKNWEIWVPPPTPLRVGVGRHPNHRDLVGVSDDQSRCGWDQPDVFQPPDSPKHVLSHLATHSR